MKGMDALVALRRRGRCPSVVDIDTDAELHGLRGVDEQMGWVHLLIEPADSLRDLRALVGVSLVQVSGFDWWHVLAVAKAARRDGARRVIASQLVRRPWGLEVTECVDSDGGETWQG